MCEVYTDTYTRKHTQTQTHANTDRAFNGVYICVYIYLYPYNVCMCEVYTHTHTHTHTQVIPSEYHFSKKTLNLNTHLYTLAVDGRRARFRPSNILRTDIANYFNLKFYLYTAAVNGRRAQGFAQQII